MASTELLLLPFYPNAAGNVASRLFASGRSLNTKLKASSNKGEMNSEARVETILGLQAKIEKMATTVMQVQESLAATQALITHLLDGMLCYACTLSNSHSFVQDEMQRFRASQENHKEHRVSSSSSDSSEAFSSEKVSTAGILSNSDVEVKTKSEMENQFKDIKFMGTTNASEDIHSSSEDIVSHATTASSQLRELRAKHLANLKAEPSLVSKEDKETDSKKCNES